VPPVRLEIPTTISGVEFAARYARRRQAELDGVPVNVIRLDDLKRNKQATSDSGGRKFLRTSARPIANRPQVNNLPHAYVRRLRRRMNP
jgi:hypothetical protein